MSTPPVSQEVAGALARYFFGGKGPPHSKLTGAFLQGGYGDDAPYDLNTGTPNKETRVQLAIGAAIRRPARAKALIDALPVSQRVASCFDATHSSFDAGNLRTLQRAFRGVGWSLSDDGILTLLSGLDLTSGGREALDEQMARIRRGTCLRL